MKMVKMLIQVPQPVKAQLDALRTEGYTASGYIRALLEQDLKARRDAGMSGKFGHKKGR